MDPEAMRSAAPAIPKYQDRRGSDAPFMLPTTLITRPPGPGFNGVCNKMVIASCAGVGLLERGDVELGHAKHGLRHPGGLPGLRVGDHLEEPGGDDLPGQPVLILQP